MLVVMSVSMLISWIVIFCVVTVADATTSCRTADGQYDVTVNFRGKHEPETRKSTVIAFYAFMSLRSAKPGIGQRLVFDVMKTNEGGGYNRHTGVFTCPKTGIYVFVWVVRLGSAYHSFELMVNNSVYGSTYLYNQATGSSVSGTVVVHASVGDSIYVRAHSTHKGTGELNSNIHGRTTFSGWLLN